MRNDSEFFCLIFSQNRPGTDYYDRNCNPQFSPSDLDDSGNNIFSRIGNRPLLAQGMSSFFKCVNSSTTLIFLLLPRTLNTLTITSDTEIEI